jgi:hypothetical protein
MRDQHSPFTLGPEPEDERVPLQNRVDPFGDIVAIAQRGLFTGNRGIIHDPATHTLLRRRWTNKAWIVCRCDFRGVRRPVMGRRSWTELFFYDEAVAFAAGHRPCYFCRRDAALAFAAAWSLAHPRRGSTARAIDDTLHAQRLDAGRKRIHALPVAPAKLPDGAMVVSSGDACLVAGGKMFRWTPAGYEKPARRVVAEGLLTPPATVAALDAGYRCILHPTLGRWLAGTGRCEATGR